MYEPPLQHPVVTKDCQSWSDRLHGSGGDSGEYSHSREYFVMVCCPSELTFVHQRARIQAAGREMRYSFHIHYKIPGSMGTGAKLHFYFELTYNYWDGILAFSHFIALII